MAEKTVAVRLSEEQNELLEKLAKKSKTNVSDFIRGLLAKETPKSPQEELEELQRETARIQVQIAEIERTEEEKRIAESERQRQVALAQIEAQIRETLPELLNLRYRALTELINNGYQTLDELSSQYDDLIEKVEAGDVESARLKEKLLQLGGDFEPIWTELMAIENVELSEGAKQLLETVRRQRASWIQRADSVLRFLDTRLVSAGLNI
jgi:uncharacterized phage infection (PIP) family protein YhgE